MNDLKRIKKGCQIGSEVRYQVEDIKFYGCIGNFYSESAVQLIELYYNYQRGVLPYPGTFLQQPSKVIDILQLIDGCIKTKQAEVEKQQYEDSKRKAKLDGKRGDRTNSR